MNEIKFRGKRVDNGKWVYGDLIHEKYGTCIKYVETEYPKGNGAPERKLIFKRHKTTVIPATIGQYTGLRDKNGKEIYEGDICRVSSDTFYSNSYATLEESWELIMQVVFCNYAFIFRCLQDKHLEILLAETLWEDFEIEIVGNIYENPELLEVKNAN